MSASLVGSEMCIRDSTASPRGDSAPRIPPQSTSGAPSGLSRCHRRIPVSYTHLTLPTICSV
eukprot:4937254-Alexandrium_andersonii.AAC.1